MSELLSKELIEDIADSMVVHPSFVEKDFYAVRILDKLSKFSCLGFIPVFSGGTSLSKGYNIIQRFSEDLDFNIYNASSLTEGQRRQIRHAFRDAIAEIDDLTIVSTQPANGGKKETIIVQYPKLFETPNQLREHLQVELFFDPEPNEKIEIRAFNSFYGGYLVGSQEIIIITCNHPFNIMADKINAIAWRIYKEGEDLDYTLMRHLHDVCALTQIIPIDDALKEKVLDNFEKKDKHRLKDAGSFVDILKATNEKLTSSKAYKDGYVRFVDSMSYAPDAEQITFEKALKCFQEISKLFF